MITTLIAAALAMAAIIVRYSSSRYEVQKLTAGKWITMHRCDSSRLSMSVMADFKKQIPNQHFRSVEVFE